MTPTDRILKIGKKLEKDGLKAFGDKTPAGHPVYFRAGGLQIIPSEAEEIDTGKSCRLIITPLAASLSALVTDLIKVIKAGASGTRRTEALITEMKSKTFQDVPREGEWEVVAAKGIVSAAIKISERSFSEPSQDGPDDWTMMDPFTGEIHEHLQKDWRHAREIFGHYARREITRPVSSVEAGASPGRSSVSVDLIWIVVCGYLGVVVSGYWIPIGNINAKPDSDVRVKLIKALGRKGLKPDIALTIIANARKSPKRTD